MEGKKSKVIIKLYVQLLLISLISESLEFLIIGKNNPKTYKRIIVIEANNIASYWINFHFILSYFSLSLGNNSTKLQGLCLISNWYFNIPSQASVTPQKIPVEQIYIFHWLIQRTLLIAWLMFQLFCNLIL